MYDGKTSEVEELKNTKELFYKLTGNTKDLPKGVAFRSKDYTTTSKELIYTGFPDSTDLTNLPLPARHLISKVYNVADIIVNRGCPNQCSFCSRTKLFPEMRIRPVEDVLKEVDYLLPTANYNFVNFYDNININHKYFNTFLDGLIERKMRFPWGAELRADVMTPEEARKLKKANCRVVATGVESASQEVLKRNFKFQNPEKVRKGIQIIKDAGLAIQAYFVIGLPGDTEELFEKTLKFTRQLPFVRGVDHVNFFVTTPYPGSDLVMHPKKYGITILEPDYDLYDCHEVLMTTETLNETQISKMVKKAKNLKAELGI